MRQKRFYRASAILLTALLLITSVVPTCFAAGSVGEVNLHIGQSADTVYLTYTSFDKAAAPVTVTGPLGTNTYPAQSVWSDSAGKYIHQATLTGLTAGTDYTYTLENGTYSSGFTTAAQTGPFTFAFLTDTQVAFDSDARATAALFDQLNQQDDLAFVYIAGDFTDFPGTSDNGSCCSGAVELTPGQVRNSWAVTFSLPPRAITTIPPSAVISPLPPQGRMWVTWSIPLITAM